MPATAQNVILRKSFATKETLLFFPHVNRLRQRTFHSIFLDNEKCFSSFMLAFLRRKLVRIAFTYSDLAEFVTLRLRCCRFFLNFYFAVQGECIHYK